MSVTKEDAQMLATLATRCRPTGARQWKPDDVMAELANLTDRNLGAVICATIRAAMDRGAERPSVIGSAGSHWSDTAVVAPFVPHIIPAEERCSICSMSEVACRITHTVEDHEFRSAAIAAKEAAAADPEALAGVIAALRAEVADPPERPADEGLNAHAKDRPELRARLDALLEANGGLATPAMQETDEEGETA